MIPRSRTLVFLLLSLVIAGLIALANGMPTHADVASARQSEVCPQTTQVLPANGHYSVANTDCAGIHDFLRDNQKQSMEAFPGQASIMNHKK